MGKVHDSPELEHVPLLPLVLRSCPHFTLDQPYSHLFNSVIPAYCNVPGVGLPLTALLTAH